MKKQSIVVSGINQLIYALSISSFDAADIIYISVEKETKINAQELQLEMELVRRIVKVFDRELYGWDTISINLSYKNFKKSYKWHGEVDITKYTHVLCSQSIFKQLRFNKKRAPTFTLLAEGASFVIGLEKFTRLYYFRFLILTIAKYVYWYARFRQKPPSIYLPVSYNDLLVKAIADKKLKFKTHTNSTYVCFSDYQKSILKIQEALLTKNNLNIEYLHLSNKLIGDDEYSEWADSLFEFVPLNKKIHFKIHPSDFRSHSSLKDKSFVFIRGKKARLPAELFINPDVKLIGWVSTTILMVAPRNVIFIAPPENNYAVISSKLFTNFRALGYDIKT